jgi:hypothetical protein
MKIYTRADVEDAVGLGFEPSQFVPVMAQLDRFGTEPHEHERERVQAAIVHLSEGDFYKLVHFVDVAKKDCRDVLYWSGF